MSKRILITAFDFPPRWGGVATYSWQVAKTMHELGYEVTVVTRASNIKFQTEFEVLNYKLPNAGISSLPILGFHLVRLLKSREFDHIFSTLWLPGGAAIWIVKKLFKISTPHSIAVHAMEIIESQETLKKRFRNKLNPLKIKTFTYANSIFCVSQFTKKLLLSLIPVNENKVTVVHNGADPKQFYPDHKKNACYPTLVTACRLQPNKGIDQVIKALPCLINQFPKLQYNIIGDGPDRKRLTRLANMMQVTDSVNFLGKIDPPELLKQFQSADLFIMLSRKEKHFVEGFGLVFLETALCGTPSLGGDSGGIPDAIIDGQTGWLVDPYDLSKIEAKLLDLLSNEDLLRKTGQSALEKTQKERTWKHCVENLLTAIEQQ